MIRNILFVAAIATVLACLSSANAEMVQTSDLAYEPGYYPCSSTDLINLDQATLLSSERDRIDMFNWQYGMAVPPTMNNGSVVDGTPVWHTAGYDEPETLYLPATYTFMLNTSIAAAGYDITSVTSFTGFNDDSGLDATLAQQKFELLMSKVGDESWFSLGTYTHAPLNEVVRTPVSEFLSLADTTGGALTYGGNTATNIDAVRVIFMDPEPAAVSYQNGTTFQELDVVGTASAAVPEPGTFVLLASSILGLLAYAWRKQS